MPFAPLFHQDDLSRWRVCPRRFWLHRHRGAAVAQGLAAAAVPADADIDASAEAAMVAGPAPGAALRAMFPAAVAIAAPAAPAEWARAVERTLRCLDSDRVPPEGWAVLGACLTSDDGTQVRIDVLACGDRGLRLWKVRHATVGDEADVDAMALWVHAAARCGLRVQSVGLLLVDTDFIYPGHGCYAGLFREVDLAPVLGSRPVSAWLAAMRACDRGPQPPVTPGAHCAQGGGCEFGGDDQACGSAQAAPPDDAQARLEIVGRELAAELREEGHADLRSVPLRRLSHARHRRAAHAIHRGRPVLAAPAGGPLQPWGWPRHSLRFDTIGFAVPIWSGTRPYQTLPFQWTCDVQDAGGALVRHGFLAGPEGDPRRAFAKTLLEALGTGGPVFAYNAGFERNRIRDLAQHFDDLAPALEALLPRIVDLFQTARARYYHPAMAGSWSFSSICRAVAPDLQVDWPEAHCGPSPQLAFARSLHPGLDAASRQQSRAALQAHGQRQTEALRRIVALFEGPAAGRG
jgi:hypothetical protein